MILVRELPARTLVRAGWLLFAAIQVRWSYSYHLSQHAPVVTAVQRN